MQITTSCDCPEPRYEAGLAQPGQYGPNKVMAMFKHNLNVIKVMVMFKPNLKVMASIKGERPCLDVNFAWNGWWQLSNPL